jgi:hypothetical protein
MESRIPATQGELGHENQYVDRSLKGGKWKTTTSQEYEHAYWILLDPEILAPLLEFSFACVSHADMNPWLGRS